MDFDADRMRPQDIQVYLNLLESLKKNTLTMEKLKETLGMLSDSMQNELSEYKETPTGWLSILSLFIPFVGIIRKWYSEQKRMYIQARMHNITFLLTIFTASEKTQKQLEDQLKVIRESQEQKSGSEGRWINHENFKI